MSKITLPYTVSKISDVFSVYQQPVVTGLIIRDKGGPSKEMMQNARQFHRLRLWQFELRGVGKAASLIMNACINKAFVEYYLKSHYNRITLNICHYLCNIVFKITV